MEPSYTIKDAASIICKQTQNTSMISQKLNYPNIRARQQADIPRGISGRHGIVITC
jgi:hypothetical protein